MGKSRKRNPIFGNGSGSEKYDKRLNNRRHRKLIRQVLEKMERVEEAEETLDLQDVMPLTNETSNPWDMNKDGKRYWVPDDSDDEYRQNLWRKMMRK